MNQKVNTFYMGPISRIHSLYNYCFYVSTPDSNILWQWRPYLYVDGEGIGIKDENGDLVEDISQIEASALMIDDLQGQTMQKLY